MFIGKNILKMTIYLKGFFLSLTKLKFDEFQADEFSFFDKNAFEGLIS